MKSKFKKLFFGFSGGKIQESKADKNQGNQNIKKHQNYIWIVHVFTFLTRKILKNHETKDTNNPDITTTQLMLSIPTRKGETTMLAKATWPISREISDKALICESVNSIESLVGI